MFLHGIAYATHELPENASARDTSKHILSLVQCARMCQRRDEWRHAQHDKPRGREQRPSKNRRAKTIIQQPRHVHKSNTKRS
jgi:hypothetical protein